MKPETKTPWYLEPDADDRRPLTPEQAAAWLRLDEFGYESPGAILAKFAHRYRVKFTLRMLRSFGHETAVGGPAIGDN